MSRAMVPARRAAQGGRGGTHTAPRVLRALRMSSRSLMPPIMAHKKDSRSDTESDDDCELDSCCPLHDENEKRE